MPLKFSFLFDSLGVLQILSGGCLCLNTAATFASLGQTKVAVESVFACNGDTLSNWMISASTSLYKKALFLCGWNRSPGSPSLSLQS